MKKLIILVLFLGVFLNFKINAKENFFDEAKSKYDEKKLEDSKFLFQRNIVFNPKDYKSYLYLALTIRKTIVSEVIDMGSLDLNEFYFWKRIRKWHVILIIVLIVVIYWWTG